MIFTVILLSTKAFALGNVGTDNLVSPIIGEGVDLAKLAGTVVGWLLALVAGLLWIITRLLSFVFKFTGGLMYGFFINNPLDTEIGYIRPLWSFLVDFGNLVVIGSFIALALVILFDIDLPVNKDLGKFAGGIVMIALLLNFSLTLTSAFASTVHSIGIGTVYATQTKNGTNLDLTSRSNFNRSVLKTGNSFFDAVNNNFVENVSCLGTGTVTYEAADSKGGGTKSMAEVCQYHKKDDKSQLNPLSLVAASDGSVEAFTFYLIVIIRELAVLVLLSVGIFVLIKLLKVSIFRLAYLWIVGIFAGPALVAAFSPFDGMKKYFQTWLKWLVVFSTMMIVFVAGFYLSSYIATINIPNAGVSYEALENPLSSPGLFVSQLVNSMVEIVVPNIMFPIIGLAIMFLLGKYLDETYQQHAEKAMKAGGKLLNEARSSVSNVGRLGAGAVGLGAGGLKNISNLGAGAANKYNTGLLKANSALAAGQRLRGNEAGARATDARAIKYAGKAAVNKQMIANKNAAIDGFISGKDYKAKRAEVEYLARQNNAEVLGRLGANTGAFAAEAKKAGVSENVIRQGKTAAQNFKFGTPAGGGPSVNERIKDIERDTAKSENKDFARQFGEVQDEMYKNIDAQRAKVTASNEQLKLDNDSRQKLDLENIEETYNALATKQGGSLTSKQTDEKAKKIDNLSIRTQTSLKEIEKRFTQTISDLDKQENNVSTGNVVTDTVNQKFMADNPEISQKVAKKIASNNNLGQTLNNTQQIRARNDEAKSVYDGIEGSANAIFAQLKAIDAEKPRAGTSAADVEYNRTVTGAEKQKRRDAVLASVPASQQEIKIMAERKYKASNSNIYGDE
jgi:hypothetical protein